MVAKNKREFRINKCNKCGFDLGWAIVCENCELIDVEEVKKDWLEGGDSQMDGDDDWDEDYEEEDEDY